MTIETRYSPRDIIWVMKDGRPSKARIYKVVVSSIPNFGPTRTELFDTVILYYTDLVKEPFEERCLFKSQEALLQSL